MKVSALNPLFIPVFISWFFAAICFYWGYKFQLLSIEAEQGNSVLEKKISTIDCAELNREVILKIAKTNVSHTTQLVDLADEVAGGFLGVGFINLFLVVGHLKRFDKTR